MLTAGDAGVLLVCHVQLCLQGTPGLVGTEVVLQPRCPFLGHALKVAKLNL